MPLRIEAHAEPIPGYRLIERLGSGGFGEVWKAEAPGGLFKAIKFVQREASFDDACSIVNSDPDHSRADQEWKSLIRVKSVRHPFILLLDRFENIENYLVIVMELADRTLADRFKECRSQGLPGIPRAELLNYLAEAAEVLDLMNSQYQLQHLDIKPQNLFLVHNHIKVADFGLVKDTTGGVKLMTITGGVTPVYAAPETFDGKFSRQSDQYSLAIVYQEMLTGHRPFTGTSMKQLILQHLQNAHDLTPVPVHDRPIIAQALTKNPEDRFPTCLDLIQQLRQATLKIDPSAQSCGPTPAPTEKPFLSVSKTVGGRGQSGPVKPVEPNFSVEAPLLHDEANDAPPSQAAPVPASEALVTPSATPVVGPRRKATDQRRSTRQLAGIVQPALVVGIGQLGVQTLTQLRLRLATELGSVNAVPHIRLVAIDTDANTLQQATNGITRAALRTQETLHARLQRPSHYLKTRDGKLATDGWLSSRLLHRIPREQTNAGLRALGRLAFVDNYRAIAKRLEAEMQALCSQDTPHSSDSALDLGLRSNRPRVYIVTSLTGNSGGGMFLDVAYLLRKLLNNQRHEQAEIVGLFYLPQVRRDGASPLPLANAYAALTELQYYCHPNAIFSAHYETAASTGKGERVTAVGPAFQRCILMPLTERKGRTAADNSDLLVRAGDFLYRDLATILGQAIDEQRLGKIRGADSAATEPLLQSVGISRILWPRHALLEECSRRLCCDLVTRWMNKDAKAMADTIRQWTAERWEALGMRPENLIERFQQLAEESLQQKPETLLAEILAMLQQLLVDPAPEAAKTKAVVNMVPVVQAVDCLERVLGNPGESRSAKQGQIEPSMIERAVEEIAREIADDCERKLAELAVTMLEDPNYRLAGAEEALRQFCTTVEQALQSQETLAKELADKSAQLFQRIQKLIETFVQSTAPTSTQWTLIAKRSAGGPVAISANDIVELVRTYAKTRYHSIVLTHLDRLYLGLRGHLSDQIREVGFCRARLGELHGLMQPALAHHKNDSAAADERTLFPPGCKDLREAVEQVRRAVTVDDLLGFDERIQAWIKSHCQALLEVCMGSSTLVKTLAPALLQEAEAFLNERLQGASVAEMYLTRKRGEFDETAEDMIFDDLQRCFDEATPEIGRISENNEISCVSLPNDEHGRQLQQLLSKRLPNVEILLSDRHDEMIFYHELIRIQWKHLEQFGPIALEAYQHRCRTDPGVLHTREDIFDWQLNAASNR
jgi:eukaryotic-like serine/threonine-protein kinase